MDKDEQILRRHLLDLANMADVRCSNMFSDFLNLNEQSIFASIKMELPMIKYFTYGGYMDSERKILCFCGNNNSIDKDDISFPVSCIRIVPFNLKFSDKLTHRDFLGAVLNLGIERNKIGDIITEDNAGYLFCNTSIRDFIIDELVKVKHTMVDTSVIDENDFRYEPTYKEINGTVSSTRLDSILSVAFQSSRSKLSALIVGKKVFVNSKLVVSNSYSLKENDVISVRGYGKFIFKGTSNITKKGRFAVKILLYTK